MESPGRGLSPRVRGNPVAFPPSRRRRRSIPACAGEPPGLPCEGVHTRVYPRVCGGTRLAVSSTVGFPGLSPRVRGNLVFPLSLQPCDGSIPACAGEPHTLPALHYVHEVYPRVCGGTVYPRVCGGTSQGLSPRVRGNRYGILDRNNKRGSIPACAGEPSIPACAGEPRRVYPRVCGGTKVEPRFEPATRGLSPRVRGNRTMPTPLAPARRSIPACAGEPGLYPILQRRVRVYPRVCGGTGAACSPAKG